MVQISFDRDRDSTDMSQLLILQNFQIEEYRRDVIGFYTFSKTKSPYCFE